MTPVTAAEAAALVECEVSTIYYWRRTGKIKPVAGAGTRWEPWLFAENDLYRNSGWLHSRALPTRILDVLDVESWMSAALLADRLDANPGSVRKALNRLRKRGLVDFSNGKWGLVDSSPPAAWRGPVGRLAL